MKRFKDRFFNGIMATPQSSNNKSSDSTENIYDRDCYTPINTTHVAKQPTNENHHEIGARNHQLTLDRSKNNGITLAKNGSFKSEQNTSQAVGKIGNSSSKTTSDSLIYCSPSIPKSKSLQFKDVSSESSETDQNCGKNSAKISPKRGPKSDQQQKQLNLPKLKPSKSENQTSKNSSTFVNKTKNSGQNFTKSGKTSSVAGRSRKNMNVPVKATVQRYSTFDEVTPNLGSQDFLSHAVLSVNQGTKGKLPRGGEYNECKATMENLPRVESGRVENLPGKYGKSLHKEGKDEFKDARGGQKSVNKFNSPGFLGENVGSENSKEKPPQNGVSSVPQYQYRAVEKDGKNDARGRKKEGFLAKFEQTQPQSYSGEHANFTSQNKTDCITDTSRYIGGCYNNNFVFNSVPDFVHVRAAKKGENLVGSNLESEETKQINYHYNNSPESTLGFPQIDVKTLAKEEPQIRSSVNSSLIPPENEKISPFNISAFSSSQPYDGACNAHRQNRPMFNSANNERSSALRSNGIENSAFHNNGLYSYGEIHGNNTYATISKREQAEKELQHIPFCERATNVGNTNDSYYSQQNHNSPASIEKYSASSSIPSPTVSYNNTAHQNTHSNLYSTLVGDRQFRENIVKQNSSNLTSGNSKIDHSPVGENSEKNKSNNNVVRNSRELLLPQNGSGKNPSSKSTVTAGETKNNKTSCENSGNNNTGTFSRNWSFKVASRSAESQTDLSLIEPKYKDACTNTEITLIPPDQKTQRSKSPLTTKQTLPSYEFIDNCGEDINYNQNIQQHIKPSSADKATELAHAVEKLVHYYSVPTSGGYLNRSLSSLYPPGYARLTPGSAGDATGTNQVLLRNPARRDWSSRHYVKERPQSFSETLSYNVRRNPESILGRGRNSRIYASTNQGRLVTPNTSRYALSSRASSTDRFLDSKYGEVEPAPFLEKGSNFEDLLDSENTFNVSQNFFSASEGSLLDDDSTTTDTRPSTTTRRNQERVTRLKDHSSSAEPTNRADSLNARFFPNNNFHQNRARSSSNDGLLRQVSSAQSRIRSTKVQNAESFGSGRGLNDHKYHKSECDLIDDCDCRTIPRLKKEARTRTVGNVCNQSGPKMSHFPEFFNEQLPKSKSTSGSIFLKQVVEPSKAFAYLTSIETLADASDNNASSDKLGSHGKIQDKLYEPLCQNCGLKGHSILKCDKISRVDKLYDVIMLGDRVTITHNEPNYVRSQKNKLPRCYHCGLKGHRSRSCSKLAPQAKAELDPFESSDPQFNAFTIPRSSRRARSEVRSAYEDAGFSIPAPDYSISNNSGLLSPISTDTALTFSNHSTMISNQLRPFEDGRSTGGYHNQFSSNTGTSSIKTPNIDLFCSDVDYGYDSSGVGFAHRPISMFETTMPPQRPVGLHINGNATDTGIDSASGTDKTRPQNSSKVFSGMKMKLKATESNPNVLTSSSKDQFQKRNTVDFDDRDSGIGYGETSSQTNLEAIPRTPVNSGHNILGHNERPVDAPDYLTKGVSENPEQASPSIESEKSDPGSDGAKSKAAKPKKKNPILRKIACITGNKNTAQ